MQRDRARSRPSSAKRRALALVVVNRNRIDESVLHALVPILGDAFGADVFTADSISLLEDAYNASRKQYHSTVLLDALVRHKRPDWERLIGVTDVDLYTPDLNFVFGEADARRGVAVFSLARLHTADRDRFAHRVATEAVHEIGHTYGWGTVPIASASCGSRIRSTRPTEREHASARPTLRRSAQRTASQHWLGGSQGDPPMNQTLGRRSES
jgi:archaemetzincin